MNTLRLSMLAALIPYLLAFAWVANAAAADVEDQVKAAYLLKFGAYVDWPPATFAQAGMPLTIGVIGAAGVAEELNRLSADHPVNNRAVLIKQLNPEETLTGVQILFVGKKESGRLRKLLDSLETQAVLTVAESSNALDDGCVINFVPVEDHIRFEVSLTSALHNGLTISGRLLSVAQRVEGRSP